MESWKQNYRVEEGKSLVLVAADVQALYPSLKRHLVKDGIRRALETCSDYNLDVINLIVDLTMFCLENVIVQNRNMFYNQMEGIITGDNHSVSVANIALHNIILPIAEDLNKAIMFQRYIDDIMFVCSSTTSSNEL